VRPQAGGRLALGAEAARAERPSGPLQVAFASPQGLVGAVTEVNVVFDRPVQPLGVAGTAPAPFRITPELPGSFRWVGSRAAVFTPAQRLPYATAFKVEVAAGLAALDGTRLSSAYRFELETPRPSLLRSAPYDGERRLGVDTRVQLELDQIVLPEALKAAASLRANGKPVAFSVSRDDKEPRALWLKPKQALPPHSTIVVTLDSSLRGTEGPLPAGREQVISFHTYDPLAVESVSCAMDDVAGRCEADSSVSLVFNNAVKPRDLQARLHVTPEAAVRVFRGSADGDTPTMYVELLGRFQAGQSYSVQIDPGLGDDFGQKTSKPLTAAFAFRDHRPRVDIGAVGRNFPGRPLSVPVASRNVESFDLLTAALSPQDLLAWRESSSKNELGWLSALKGTTVQRVRPGGAKNRIERLALETARVLGQSGRGALAIGARYAPEPGDYNVPPQVKVLNVSDLGITAKLSRFGSLVWVTDRGSNAPVASAQVELVMPGRKPLSYMTDSDGVAHIPAADFAPDLTQDSAEAKAILVARRGSDSAFAPVAEYLESWRLDVPTDFSGQLRHYGVLFTDRGIYRPGDAVMVKGIVRRETPTGNALPGEKPVTLSLRAPSGDELSRQDVMLTSYGTLSGKLNIPGGSELGTYYATVSGLGSERFLEQSLEVSEYRPVQLKVFAGAERPSYVRGDSALLEVKGDYLFGAVAAGLSSSVSVSRQPTWFEVPGAADYATSASWFYDELSETSPAAELRRETRALDAQGRITWSEKLDLPAQRGTELLRIDAEVTDISRQSVASSGSAIVHPASFYLGVKIENSGFVDAPGKVSPRVVALEPSGRRLSGKRVTLELIERRYSYAREASGDDYRGVSKPVDRQVARCELSTGEQDASCALAVPAAGYYLIVARGVDERKNPVEAATSIYAAGAGEPTWQDNDRRSLALVLDKKSYAVGQRARVLVKSPYKEAEALITVERSGVYHSFHRLLRGTAPSFEIPVTSELLPNAFVGVHLLPRRTGKGAPLEAGSYRVGYANLRVDGEARRLTVRVSPNKADYRPGESIDVKLSVKDARGAAAANTELTLYAADEGVLSLIDYRTPDPLAVFSGARALQVATLESRDAEGRIVLESLGGRDKGRDGGGGGDDGARRDFRQTAYFNPRIMTDARGEAKATFKLPESLSSYRLMAVAVGTEDRYGFSQARVTTSKPLMARPALPRFVRAGDSFEASLLVTKKRLGAGKVKVAAAFEGVSAKSPLLRELEVPENGSIEVRFPVEAPHPGKASVRFEVTAGAERDVVTQSLPILVPMTPEASAVYGQTSDARSEQLGDLSAVRDDAGGLSISLASSALVGLDQTALDLIEYPYSCSEQLSSRILPLVAFGDLAKALGFPLPSDAKQRASAAVGELLARQQGDGGFAMWPESGESSPWVSPYATLALWRAARAGVPVSKPALERARAYLRQVTQLAFAEPWHLPVAALALDVQAELGAPDPGGINQLFLRRKELPLFGKALLLHAAVHAKLGSDVVSVLTRDLENAVHVSGDRALIQDDAGENYRAWLDSETRTQAMVLRALSARGSHPLLSELARGLIGSRKLGRFRTTQEGAWALLALDDYRRVAEPEAPRFEAVVSLGGARLGSATFESAPPLSQRVELPLSQLLAHQGAPLVLEKRGAGKLHYEARLRYVRKKLPNEPLDSGFFVEKSLHSVSAEELRQGGIGAPPGIARELASGALVLVDLTVVTPAPREYVVVDDALPAGLEAIDPKLTTTASWLKDPGPSAGEAGESERLAYERSEVRDDRVLFFADRLPAGLWHYRYLARATTRGHFVLPPTRVEEMYEPEVFGRNGAAELVVR
jgi:alpha-2-macroglobulin